MHEPIERRVLDRPITLREAEGAAPARLVGHAALFETRSNPLVLHDEKTREKLSFVEVISRGAFTASLASVDVKALWSHDQRLILSRMGNGGLSLAEDEVGLAYDCPVPMTSYGLDLLTSVRLGNANQCSFGFDPDDIDEEWSEEAGVILHRINRCVLKEISLGVTFPAYPATTVALRSARSSFSRSIAGARSIATQNRDRARRHLDLLDLD